MRPQLALLVLLVAAAPASAFVTRVSSTFALSDAADSNILCPVGAPLGGGFQTANPGVARARGTGVDEPEMPGDPIERWAVQLLNPSGTFQDYRFAAVCGSLPALEYVFESTSQPGGVASSDSVSCPTGKVAIGGGALTTGGGVDSRLTASGPTFPTSIFGAGLADQPDGEAPLPRGWDVGYDNVGLATTGIVFVVCADYDDVHPVVDSEFVPAGSSALAIAECPPGTAAVGGGFDAQDRSGLRLAASAPLFPGFVFRDDLFDVDGSTTEDADAWRVVVRNDSLTGETFQVVAMCVPEPAANAAAALACGALVALRRRG